MSCAGNAGSDYLWICDPIDGTTNFTHSYPPFAVSVGVLENGVPVAGAVVEFAGSQGNWHTRMYTAYKGGGTFLDGRKVHVSNEDSVQQSLLVIFCLALARLHGYPRVFLLPFQCFEPSSSVHKPELQNDCSMEMTTR